MEKKVSAILLDLGGVILNLNYNKTITAFKKMGEERFDELYSQAEQNAIFDRFETGEISADYFRNYLISHLGEAISHASVDQAWNAMLLDLPKERIDFLMELKKHYKIYLFSNTNAIHLDAFKTIIKNQYGDADLLEKVFHKTYYSHLIQKRKPNPSAFQFILDDLNLKPEEVVFIDDSIQHVEGAKSIGINAYHLVDTDVINLLNGILGE
ncbi:MAG: HAD family phosphatase [Flavobacteriaceae bacterium]|nr:HAD family phosphatase [Flavobacteriaceae bacterium]